MTRNDITPAKLPDWDSFLVEILREEIASRDAELGELRESLRYRVGSWALEAFPPGRGTIVFLVRVLRLFLGRRHQVRSTPAARANVDTEQPGNTGGALKKRASIVVFGDKVPAVYSGQNVWRTSDAACVAYRLDSNDSMPGTLVVRQVSEMVSRRVARARRDQWHVVWNPEEGGDVQDPAIAAYMRAHADEIGSAKEAQS